MSTMKVLIKHYLRSYAIKWKEFIYQVVEKFEDVCFDAHKVG